MSGGGDDDRIKIAETLPILSALSVCGNDGFGAQGGLGVPRNFVRWRFFMHLNSVCVSSSQVCISSHFSFRSFNIISGLSLGTLRATELSALNIPPFLGVYMLAS